MAAIIETTKELRAMQDTYPKHNSPKAALVKIATFIDKFNKSVCVAVSMATLLMVLLTFVIVLLRYGAGLGWIAMQESVLYLHGLVFMVGMAYTLSTDDHVRVDVFYRHFNAQRKAWVNIFGCLLLLAPTCLVVLYFSFSYVAESWRLLESSKEAGGLPLVYLLKTLIPLSAILLLLQGVSEVLKSINILRQNGEAH